MGEPTMIELCERLTRARESFQGADQRANIANCERLDALNRLNEAQRAVGIAMETLAKEAPRESDWGRKRP